MKSKKNLISKRAKKQIELFEVLQSCFDSNKKEIKIKDLPNHLRSNSLLKSLESKSIIEIYYDKISRFDFQIFRSTTFQIFLMNNNRLMI